MKNFGEYKTALTLTGTALLTISGACWGYVIAHSELEKQFDRNFESALSEEVDKVRRFYATYHKTASPEDFSTLTDKPDEQITTEESDGTDFYISKASLSTPEGREKVLAAVRSIVESENIVAPEVSDDGTDEAIVESNAFEDLPDYDEQELVEARSPEHPYVVSRDEFIRNDAHHEVYVLKFFETDGILVDEKDDVIPDTDMTVGDDNLQRFGVMSEQPNVVYIQNDATEAMFEVRRIYSSYTEHVFGVPDEEGGDHMSHSSMRRRRSRREDE